MKWKVGDKCFYRFDLCEVTEVKDGDVTCVTDGYFSSSGTHLNNDIFPIDMEGKRISERFGELYKSVSNERLVRNTSGVFQG